MTSLSSISYCVFLPTLYLSTKLRLFWNQTGCFRTHSWIHFYFKTHETSWCSYSESMESNRVFQLFRQRQISFRKLCQSWSFQLNFRTWQPVKDRIKEQSCISRDAIYLSENGKLFSIPSYGNAKWLRECIRWFRVAEQDYLFYLSFLVKTSLIWYFKPIFGT